MESDKLVRLSDVRLIESNPNAYPEDWNEYYERGFCDAINAVLDIPAVDDVEVRHAYWKNDHESQTTPLKDGYNCSACGEPATTAYNGAVRSRWCPWCGAKMDGRREEGDA